MGLADKTCIPCRGGVPPMEPVKAREMLKELDSGWALTLNAKRLERTYPFKDFAQAMAFANRVGEVAEAEGHHPDLHVSWGKCRVEIWTHKIDGLTESDFYFAAKADREFAKSG
ncbi:MAG: 4a-hydroxytetrahydrobiopterin dehydratase [Nitrospirae bacterium]|nr:4a-hydroxytetrahydrobiopterin dehydratase [Nitrospirota bacterium]